MREKTPGRSGNGTRKRNRGAKEQALLQAATDLFAARGFERTTTREIAARAGCAEGLIHRYFQGKAGLLLALIRREKGKLTLQRHGLAPAANLQEEIQQLLESEMSRAWEDRDFLRVAVPEALRDPKLGRFVSSIGPDRQLETIHERLQRFRNNGSGPRAEETQAVAQAIGTLGFALGFVRESVFGLDHQHSKRLASQMARIFSRGLQPC